MNTFVIVDDDFENFVTLLDLVETAFPGCTVLPPYQADDSPVTFSDWNPVFKLLQEVSVADAVICIDLAIRDSDNQDVIRGVEKVKAIRAMAHKLKRDWTFIAYTRNSIRAALVADFKDVFHGVIEKGRLDPLSSSERVAYVRDTVRSALRRQRAAVADPLSGVRIVDSLGMRLLRAALGDDVLAELIEKEAREWSELSVEGLSSGHSGAFMIVLRGTNNGPRSIVIKIARDERIIDHEVRAVSDHLAALGPLNGVLCAVDSKGKQALMGGSAFYYCQAEVEGVSLLSALTLGSPEAYDALNHVLQVCVDVCESTKLEQADRIAAARAFPLTAVDLGRLSRSAGFQRTLGLSLIDRGIVPTLPIDRWCSDLIELATHWSDAALTQSELPLVVQHGDLNPGNVIMRKHAAPVFIDFARLKPWPIGYDLSRLGLMLRLHLLGAESEATEWFPDELPTWLNAGVDTLSSGTTRLCPAAAACDDAFETFLVRQEHEARTLLLRGRHLATLWDLLKVISYQDISPFKRFWALCNAGTLLDRLTDSVER